MTKLSKYVLSDGCMDEFVFQNVKNRGRQYWNRDILEKTITETNNPVKFPYSDYLSKNETLRKVLHSLYEFGFCIVSQVIN